MVRKLLAAPAVAMILLAACGSDETTESTAAPTTPATAAAASETTAAAATETTAAAAPATTAPAAVSGMIQKPGECGLGTGEPATGEPIKLGGMATNVPGIDFTWIPKMASIYFDCVNANGGINGRPIDYNYFEEHIDAQEIASLATKLVEEDQVLGIVGNTSISECGVNGKYYTDKGYYAIIAGVSPDCFSQPNFSALNMGPYYSTLGGAQAAVNAGAKGKIVVVSPNQPGMDFNNSGAMDFGKSKGLEAVGRLEEVPFADPSGLAQALVAEAGDGGAVVLDFTGPTVVPLLQAIEQQGLVDKVIWASSTPPNDPSVATAVSSAWNDKFLINAEFNLLDSGEPDQDHMNALYDAAKPDFPISSFAQMGYLIGRATTEALLGITGDFTKETVNDAFKNIKGFTSDMLCKPWYYDSGVGSNVSNNSDRTVAPRDGKMVQIEDCFDVAALPGNPLDKIRANEG